MEGEKAGASNKPGSVDRQPFIWDSCHQLPQATYPGVRSEPTVRASSRTPLFGLAPGGVYRAASCYQSRGALLPHLFTLTGRKPGGIFSVALSIGSRLPGVTWRPVRRSPDFPLQRTAAIVWPTPAFSAADSTPGIHRLRVAEDAHPRAFSFSPFSCGSGIELCAQPSRFRCTLPHLWPQARCSQ